MENGTTGPIHFLNLEYFFRLLYESRVGITGSSTPITLFDGFIEWVTHTWSVLGTVSFVFSLVAFAILAYSTVRMFQIKEREEHERWSTLDMSEAEKEKDHSRWAHIQALIESPQERDWHEAISEADIMLDDLLEERHYAGETTEERLAKADPATFKTLTEAREAHQLRIDMLLGGPDFKLDDHTAYRTIKKYELVFKEFGEI
ncbi:MAG TPA: hypothetical protein PK109_00675 [Candidatus Paceibacterota bacterium]|nr:hypothetical protein [Candidatus Paceibacterota bacterium]